MKKKPNQIVVRITDEQSKRLDDFAEKIEKQYPGLLPNLSSVVRMLMERGMKAIEEEDEEGK